MKKFMLVMLLSVAALCPARAENFSDINWGEKIAFYLPNRILDAFDFVSANLGIGPAFEARLMFTRYCDVGAGWSAGTAKVYKDYNRQYGAGIEEGWYWSAVCVGEEEYRITEATPMMDMYVERFAGVPNPLTRTYNIINGPRDFWAIGGSLGFIVDGNLYIHPLELADFVLGFFFIDIKEDDLTLDRF